MPFCSWSVPYRKDPRREYVEALVEVKDVLGEVVEIWGEEEDKNRGSKTNK